MKKKNFFSKLLFFFLKKERKRSSELSIFKCLLFYRVRLFLPIDDSLPTYGSRLPDTS